MSRGRNQHFVPQFLMRPFSEGGNGASIAVLRLEKGMVIRGAPIRSQCSRPWYYGRNGLDDFLTTLEDEAAPVVAEVLQARKAPERGTPLHYPLLFFVSVQLARTPAALANSQALRTNMVREILRQYQKHGRFLELDADTYYRPHAEPFRTPLIAGIQAAEYLADLHAVLVENEAETEFVLSDLGLTAHNQWRQDHSHQDHAGHASAGLQLFWPLTPRLMLVFFDSDVYRVRRGRNGRVVLKRNQDVRQLNQLTIGDAYQNIYFTGHRATDCQITGKVSRERARHEAQRFARIIDAPDTSFFVTYTRPPTARVDLPVLSIRSCRPPPPPRAFVFRPWPSHLMAEEDSRSAEKERSSAE